MELAFENLQMFQKLAAPLGRLEQPVLGLVPWGPSLVVAKCA